MNFSMKFNIILLLYKSFFNIFVELHLIFPTFFTDLSFFKQAPHTALHATMLLTIQAG